jgi:hypothetical protein
MNVDTDSYIKKSEYAIQTNKSFLDIHEQIYKDLDFYNQNSINKLIIDLIIDECSARSLDNIEEIILFFRNNKSKQKQDPNITIQIPFHEMNSRILNLIEELDRNVPRLNTIILINDADGFRFLTDDLQKCIDQLMKYSIQFKIKLFIKKSYKFLTILTKKLMHFKSDNNYIWKFLAKEFLIIDVDTNCKDINIELLADQIFKTWKLFPELDQTCLYSRTGFLKLFYLIKEFWFINNMLQRNSKNKNYNYNFIGNGLSDKQDNTLRLFEKVITNALTIVKYNELSYQTNNVVLEFNIDSICDTLECQSPVFINNSLILEKACTNDL